MMYLLKSVNSHKLVGHHAATKWPSRDFSTVHGPEGFAGSLLYPLVPLG